SIGGGLSAGGYGFYHMNVLSLFDPSGWSRVLPDIPGGPGDYEGFNFLGLGLIVLLACALPVLVKGRARLLKRIRKHPFPLLAFVGLTLYAITNQIGVGPYQFGFQLPDFMTGIVNVFRTSGRMFWPVFYAIVCTILFLV